MTPDTGSIDELVAALRARAADPQRRTELVRTRLSGLLRRRSAPGLHPTDLRAIRAAEEELSLTFPPLLVRLYTEVADGGFGPGVGLLELGQVVRETRSLRTGRELPRGRAWPMTLVPLVPLDPGWTCLDAATGRVIDWDPEDLTEHAGSARFEASFSERSPSLEAWLTRWVRSKTAADRNKPSRREREARMRSRAQTPEAMARQHRKAQAAIAAMSPEDRARYGLTLDDEAPPGEGDAPGWG